MSTSLGGKSDPQGIMQNTKFWPFYQMHKSEPVIENETHSMDFFEIQMDYLIPARDQTKWKFSKKKRTCCSTDFDVPTEYKVKIEGSEKIEKYLDLARELKKTVER